MKTKLSEIDTDEVSLVDNPAVKRLFILVKREGNVKVFERIRRDRLEKGLSREEIAKKIGVATADYASFEKGKSDLPDEVIEKLADELGYQPQADDAEDDTDASDDSGDATEGDSDEANQADGDSDEANQADGDSDESEADSSGAAGDEGDTGSDSNASPVNEAADSPNDASDTVEVAKSFDKLAAAVTDARARIAGGAREPDVLRKSLNEISNLIWKIRPTGGTAVLTKKADVLVAEAQTTDEFDRAADILSKALADIEDDDTESRRDEADNVTKRDDGNDSKDDALLTEIKKVRQRLEALEKVGYSRSDENDEPEDVEKGRRWSFLRGN